MSSTSAQSGQNCMCARVSSRCKYQPLAHSLQTVGECGKDLVSQALHDKQDVRIVLETFWARAQLTSQQHISAIMKKSPCNAACCDNQNMSIFQVKNLPCITLRKSCTSPTQSSTQLSMLRVHKRRMCSACWSSGKCLPYIWPIILRYSNFQQAFKMASAVSHAASVNFCHWNFCWGPQCPCSPTTHLAWNTMQMIHRSAFKVTAQSSNAQGSRITVKAK